MTIDFSRPPTVALFVPADRPERFQKAMGSGADIVIVDLEDAVASENKASARANVAALLRYQSNLVVRINAPGSPWHQEDLAAVAGRSAAVAAVMVPKVESVDELRQVRAHLDEATRIVPLIESAAGIARLEHLLTCDGIWCAAFGSLDFALDLSCAHTWDALLMARSRLVLHSRLAGLPSPIDGVTTAIDNPDLCEADALRASQLGFGGKLAVHPNQIDAIRRGFQPDAASISWAHSVVDASLAGGAARVQGAMVDRPVVERARRILIQAREAQE